MLSAIKEIPGTIKSWRDNRESIYNLVATIAAALVVAAVATGTRPSDALAAVARHIQLTPVAEWLTGLSLANDPAPAVNGIMLTALLVLLAWMVVIPLVRSRHDDNQMFAYEPLRLVGAPAAATVWLLLFVAAQYGDIAAPLRSWAHTAFAAARWVLGGLAAAGVLYLLARRYGMDDLARLLLWPPAVVVYRVYVGICFTGVAVVVAAVGIPVGIISWFAGLESDRSRKIRDDIERERIEREPVATGAAIVRLDRAA